MDRDLTTEERFWCLEQAITLVKEGSHGGASSVRDTADALQSLYQVLCALRREIKAQAKRDDVSPTG